MPHYTAVFETKTQVVSDAHFVASNLKEAKGFAQLHKRNTPEIAKVGKAIKTTVRRN